MGFGQHHKGSASSVVIESDQPFTLTVSPDDVIMAVSPGPVSILPDENDDETVVINLISGQSVNSPGIKIGNMTGGVISTGRSVNSSVSASVVNVPRGMTVSVPSGKMTPGAGVLALTVEER